MTQHEKFLFGALCALLLACSPVLSRELRAGQLNIRITEIERMNWGTVAIPPSGTQYVDLSPLGQGTHGTGTVLFGAPQRGVYRLSGSGNDCGAITIDIDNVSSGSSDLALDHFEGIYSSTLIRNFPSPTLPSPDARGTPLYLGARATVGSAMNARNLTPSFDINVIVN